MIKETASYGLVSGESAEHQRRIEQMLFAKFNLDDDQENEGHLIKTLIKQTGKHYKEDDLMQSSGDEMF
jgi:hypothetical protein